MGGMARSNRPLLDDPDAFADWRWRDTLGLLAAHALGGVLAHTPRARRRGRATATIRPMDVDRPRVGIRYGDGDR